MARRRKQPQRKPRKAATPSFVRRPPPVADPVTRPPLPRAAPRKTKRQRDLELAEAYRITFQSPFGEKVLADLMLHCGVYNPIDDRDPITVGMRMGERNVAMHIAKMRGLRPEHFPDEAWRVAGIADEMMSTYA